VRRIESARVPDQGRERPFEYESGCGSVVQRSKLSGIEPGGRASRPFDRPLCLQQQRGLAGASSTVDDVVAGSRDGVEPNSRVLDVSEAGQRLRCSRASFEQLDKMVHR
jgi:hypothetical protein